MFGTSEPSGTFTRNPSWNLGTCRNLCSEPFLEPRNLPEPLLGTLLGTSEPAGTRRDDCPRVPQGLVWLGPQSFQLLGKKISNKNIKKGLHRILLQVWQVYSLLSRKSNLPILNNFSASCRDRRGQGHSMHPSLLLVAAFKLPIFLSKAGLFSWSCF